MSQAREASSSVAPPPPLAERRSVSPSMSQAAAPVVPPQAAAPPPPPPVTPEAATVQCLSDIQRYISSEMAVQQEEWTFVDKCNASLRARYARLNQRADVVTHAVEEARKLMDRLPEYYSKVDELERTLDALELVANGLDTYTKVLEGRFVSGEDSDRRAPAAVPVVDDRGGSLP